MAGNELVDGSEKYYEAEDGLNVVLTIDEAIQYYVEKALEEGMEKTDAEKIMCLVMDPKTGEILASAVTPGFDPNNATEPDDEEEKEAYEALSDDEKIAYLNKMWRNPIVSDTYEPGSTFKLITASSALEEKCHMPPPILLPAILKSNVAGVTLHCWSTKGSRYSDHKAGSGQFLQSGTWQQVAGKMGAETFYKYIDLYRHNRKDRCGLSGRNWFHHCTIWTTWVQ